MAYQPDPITVRQALGALGLGSPIARAFVAFTATASILYASGVPKQAFDDQGIVLPFAPLAPDGLGVTYSHFLVVPVGIATAVYLFT